jgi:hypothetical protein
MDDRLTEWLASVRHDPYAFVLGAFPWGEPNTTMASFAGPEDWQRRVLDMIRDGLTAGLDLNQAVQIAIASGHGVGKTALVSWIILWAISTCVDTRGVVTANTEPQLKTKTWAELGKWYNLFIAKDRFKFTATAIFAADASHEKTWRVDMIPWSENNPEAFAGLHNQGRRILVLFDEASAIADKIWETTEGALTDDNTEIVWIVCGNPTRNTGRFRECFPGQKHARTWRTFQVDSRTVSFTNKDQITRWIDREGEDSDFVRIRVRGVFPRAGEMEFISIELVAEAAGREPASFKHDPLVLGVDVARYGDNESVIFIRKGRDAQSIAPVRLRGADTVAVAARVAECYHYYRADAVFVDGGGVGGGVVDQLRQLHISCFDVQFGGKPDAVGFAQGDDGVRYANKRAEMWGSMRAWLRGGSIPAEPDLRAQLIGPLYTFNLRNEIQLERKEDMRKRGLDSPDLADALALTFAYPVSAHSAAGGEHAVPAISTEYNPFSADRMMPERRQEREAA